MKKLLLLVTLLAALAGIVWLTRTQPPVAAALARLQQLTHPNGTPEVAAATSSAPSPKPDGPPPAPVVAGLVETKDVPIYLNGLGNVLGFNTVTVRPRVDGQLEKVFFNEGQEVEEGQLLVQIDARPFQAALDQALAKRKQDEALLANAKRDLARDLALLADKAGTAQKADTQQALVDQLAATLTADDATIEAASVQLGHATVHSPIKGRTGIRLIDAGNVVRAQDPTGLVVITQMQPVSVVFTLPEQQLQTIRTESEKGPLQVLAVARDNSSRLAEGTLSVIDNQIDPATGTIRMKATFPNTDLKLWPGQFVNIRLRVAVRNAATVVPAQVVQYGPSGTFAYVITPEGTAELRTLQVGRVEDGLALIDSGLQAGERVVVDGQYRVLPGGKVRTNLGGKPGGDSKRGLSEKGEKSEKADKPEKSEKAEAGGHAPTAEGGHSKK